ncbi:MAG: hypothetical protein GX020_01960 [Firmicutes bacterium]|nr:hypothetical protein [Bacillota bacterium]
MLYTIVPEEEVMNEAESDTRSYLNLEFRGVMMQVEALGNFQFRVERVISSDPQIYLEPQWQPGTIFGLEDFE